MRFALRSSRDADEPFLYSLYAATHGRQFMLPPLAPAQRDALIRMQFDAQRAGYREQYPHSQDFVVMTGQAPAGRLWLNETAAEFLIVDVALAPEYQGRGLGTAVLRQVIDRASRAGKSVRLQVAQSNARAAQLYRRLGFQVRSANEVAEEMELRPNGSPTCTLA